MKFDMNRAWGDAVALFKANREVIAVVAGVFFLLPVFAAGILFADLIAQANLDLAVQLRRLQDSSEFTFTGAIRNHLMLSGTLVLVTLFGISTLLGLLNDRGRPTLGQALSLAARGIPSLIAAILLFTGAYLLGGFLIGLISSAFEALLGTDVVGNLLAILYLGFMFYAVTRLSMTLPVIVLERILNPAAAFAGSWKLTKGKALAMFAFYFLLMLAYLAITWVLTGMALPGLREVLGGGTVGGTAVNLIGGLVEALVLSLFACLLASIHRQLADPAANSLAGKFG